MEGQPNFTTGANQLTNTLQGMMKSVSDKPPMLDFGIINSDYSLTTNNFRQPIPKTQYNVARHLLYDPSVPLTETYTDGSHTHDCAGGCPWPEPSGAHKHKVKLPAKMRWLKPNDRVIVAWIQNEAVVLDVCYSAKWLGESEPPWK